METVNGIRLLRLDVYLDERGKLVPLECNRNLPFDLHRAFFIYQVPAGMERGGHAHKSCHQVLVAAHGAVTVRAGGHLYPLADPCDGLYIPPGVRIDMLDFTPDCVLLVLASEYYDSNDYLTTD